MLWYMFCTLLHCTLYNVQCTCTEGICPNLSIRNFSSQTNSIVEVLRGNEFLLRLQSENVQYSPWLQLYSVQYFWLAVSQAERALVQYVTCTYSSSVTGDC